MKQGLGRKAIAWLMSAMMVITFVPATSFAEGNGEEGSMPAFERSEELDGVIVTVKAEEGIFPEDASLSVSYVSEEEQERVDAAVEAECEEDVNIAESYTFDIKVLDAEGNELQPPDGQTVDVSFRLAKAGDENLDAGIYHIKEAEETEDGTEPEAELLETVRDENAQTLEAQTDGFSIYALVFTYDDLYYVLAEDSALIRWDIMPAVGLRGEVQNAWTSNDLYFGIRYTTSGPLIVSKVTDMEINETLYVVIDDTTYEIAITNGCVVSSWADLKKTINDAPNNKNTFILLNPDPEDSSRNGIFRPGGDSQDDDDVIKIPRNKMITLDLNGCTIDSHRDAMTHDDGLTRTFQNGSVLKVENGGNLTIKDSGFNGEGTIRGGNSRRGGGLYIEEGGTCTIESGTITDNHAALYGGGIYVNGTLTMTGGKIVRNYTIDGYGGGIFVDTKGTIQLDGAEIINNLAVSSKNNGGYSHLAPTDIYSMHGGGGLFLILGNNNSYIKNCEINNNYAMDRSGQFYQADERRNSYGGGLLLYATKAATAITIENTTFNNNESENYGGALYLKQGTLNMTGGTINGNVGYVAGGGVGIAGNGTFNANKVEISRNSNNSAGWTGSSDGNGAGIYNAGTCTLTECSLNKNGALNFGGGIYHKSGALTLKDTTIMENSAMMHGGIYAASNLTAEGNTVVSENLPGDVWLTHGKTIGIGAGKLGSGANIGVLLQDHIGTFTSGFTDAMGESDTPDTYFFSNEYLVTMQNGEGYLMQDLDEEHKFLKRSDRIEPNVGRLSPTNWLAGISGERYLNEINMPGTHDSSMCNVSHKGCPTGKLGATFAQTQKVFLNEAFEQGARYIDLRLNNKYCSGEISMGFLGIGATIIGACIPIVGAIAVPAIITATGVAVANESAIAKFKDDGKNLWLCHGTTKAGTFYALESNGDRLSLATELEWIKEFLRYHPTETIIINFQVESPSPSSAPFIRERLKGILEKLSTEINPATGESYVYWEDGKVCQPYTHWPQLKDCRGKIIPWGNNKEIVDVIGGMSSGIPAGGSEAITTERPEGSFKDDAREKISHLTDFFRDRNVPIPRDAHKENGLKVRYSIGTNGTDEIHLNTPLDIAEKVLPATFGEGKIIGSHKVGIHIGWFGMDGASAREYKNVWITNFPADLDYCTIIVKSGLNPETAPDQIYKVLRGTTISIPDCIYDDAQAGNKADKFKGWEANTDNKIYIQNNNYTVETNVTFTARWADDIQTPVEIVWKDAENLDDIRPDALTISFNEGYSKPITAEGDWTIMLSGNITGKPSVTDVPEGYAVTKVEGEQGSKGYTITMTHTPDVSVNASGTVHWNDQNDADRVRPDSVTLRLYANGEVVRTGTASKDGGWKFDLGTFPRYKDGELLAYQLVEDEIVVDETVMANGYSNGVEEIGGDKGAINGYMVTNSHELTTTMFYGRIEWDDNDNSRGKRPESVNIRWLKNGEVISEEAVTEGEDGVWEFGLELTNAELREIAETQDALAVKYQNGEMTDEEFTAAMEKTITYALQQDYIDEYKTTVTLKSGTDPESGEKTTYYQIVNKYGKHEHVLTPTQAKAATCTENGNTAYWTCNGGDSPCWRYFSDAEGKNEIEKDSWIIKATGHDWGNISYTWAEDNKSVTAKRICQNDASHFETETVNASSQITKDATCIAKGEMTYTGSAFENEDFEAQTKKEEIAVDPDAHDWGDWVVTKKATKKKAGLKTRTCKNDPTHVETEVIPKKGGKVIPDVKPCKQDETCPIYPFKDSDPKAWYHDGVHWAIEEELMKGTKSTAFAPNTTITRAMIVTILWRMEKEPAADASAFKDVKADSWYEEAVNWAAAKGVVNGTSATTFSPNDSITREQFAAILYRYTKMKGVDVSAQADLSVYEDAGEISGYARPAMVWANDTGLITGVTETRLQPKGNATRAQAATIFYRYCSEE